GVVRVVQAPVGNGRTRNCRMKDVGTTQHGQRREVPAERPAANADPGEVEVAVRFTERVQRIDLVIEYRCREVAGNLVLPRGPAPGRAATINDDHRESLVCKELRVEI